MARLTNAAGRRLLTGKPVGTVVDRLVHGHHSLLWGRTYPTRAFRQTLGVLEPTGLLHVNPDRPYPEDVRLTVRGQRLCFGGRSDGWVLFNWAVTAPTPDWPSSGSHHVTRFDHYTWGIPLTPGLTPWADWCRRAYDRIPQAVNRGITFVVGAPPYVLPWNDDIRRHAELVAEIMPPAIRVGRWQGHLARTRVVCVPIIGPREAVVVVVRGGTAVVTSLELVLHHRRAVVSLLDVADL